MNTEKIKTLIEGLIVPLPTVKAKINDRLMYKDGACLIYHLCNAEREALNDEKGGNKRHAFLVLDLLAEHLAARSTDKLTEKLQEARPNG